MNEAHEVIEKLRAMGDPKSLAAMARYGINPDKALGVRIPILRRMAREIGKDHRLAGQLWRQRSTKREFWRE